MFWVARRSGFDESRSWQLSPFGHSISSGTCIFLMKDGTSNFMVEDINMAHPRYANCPEDSRHSSHHGRPWS